MSLKEQWNVLRRVLRFADMEMSLRRCGNFFLHHHRTLRRLLQVGTNAEYASLTPFYPSYLLHIIFSVRSTVPCFQGAMFQLSLGCTINVYMAETIKMRSLTGSVLYESVVPKLRMHAE
jgi:hypothetical protein